MRILFLYSKFRFKVPNKSNKTFQKPKKSSQSYLKKSQDNLRPNFLSVFKSLNNTCSKFLTLCVVKLNSTKLLWSLLASSLSLMWIFLPNFSTVFSIRFLKNFAKLILSSMTSSLMNNRNLKITISWNFTFKPSTSRAEMMQNLFKNSPWKKCMETSRDFIPILSRHSRMNSKNMKE